MVCNFIIKILSLFIVWLCVGTMLNSCTKDKMYSSMHKGSVKIRLKGVSYSSNLMNKNSKNSSNVNSVEEPQQIIVETKGFSILATLTSIDEKNESLKGDLHKKTAGLQTDYLDPFTAYRVVVYNANGTYYKHQDFNYGDEALISDLDDEKTYTFVAYSVNTTDIADLPTIDTSEDLNDVSILVANDREYLMYYKTQLTVDYQEDNYLDIVLDHKFSQITTTVSINNSAFLNGARIKSIDAPIINSESQFVVMKLVDGAMTYSSHTAGKSLTGGFIASGGVQTVVYDPVNIISDDVTNAIMNFPRLTISTGSTIGVFFDVTNVDFNLSNLNIKPGHRYNLNLNIIMPCVEKVESTALYSVVWPETFGVVNNSDVFNFDSSDYGVEINIYSLDQTFQLLINNQPIFIREAEFDYYGYDPNAPGGDGEDLDDVRFVSDDGRYWFDTYFNSIYDLMGDASANKPIVKVIIDVNGNVTLYGSRTSHDDVAYKLEPLYLVNGNGLNQVHWNNVGTNQVVLRQTSYGPTSISYNIAGYKKVICP